VRRRGTKAKICRTVDMLRLLAPRYDIGEPEWDTPQPRRENSDGQLSASPLAIVLEPTEDVEESSTEVGSTRIHQQFPADRGGDYRKKYTKPAPPSGRAPIKN